MKPAKATAIGRSALRIIGFKSQGFDVVLSNLQRAQITTISGEIDNFH